MATFIAPKDSFCYWCEAAIKAGQECVNYTHLWFCDESCKQEFITPEPWEDVPHEDTPSLPDPWWAYS